MQIKNCEELVLGPALAIETVPAPSCQISKFSSSNDAACPARAAGAAAVSHSGHSGGDEGKVDGGGLPWGPRCVGSFLVTFPGPSLCRGGGI